MGAKATLVGSWELGVFLYSTTFIIAYILFIFDINLLVSEKDQTVLGVMLYPISIMKRGSCLSVCVSVCLCV